MSDSQKRITEVFNQISDAAGSLIHTEKALTNADSLSSAEKGQLALKIENEIINYLHRANKRVPAKITNLIFIDLLGGNVPKSSARQNLNLISLFRWVHNNTKDPSEYICDMVKTVDFIGEELLSDPKKLESIIRTVDKRHSPKKP